MNAMQVGEFLSELTELSRKHKIIIYSPETPFLLDLEHTESNGSYYVDGYFCSLMWRTPE